jgi:sugar lactone lactonase YvrE
VADRSFTTLLDGGSYFEAPRWHGGRWWVSDFYRREVLALTPDGRAERVAQVDGQPSGLGWTPDGTLWVVSMTDHRVLAIGPDGALAEVADLSPWCGGHANDMVVAADGTAWVGNFGFDLMAMADSAPATLVRVDPDGTAARAADDLLFPNGAVIAPDGRTLIVAETLGARLTAFTIADDGELTDRRVWGQLAPTPPSGPAEEVIGALRVAPDGCTLDADGHVWAADALGGRAIRVAPGGQIVDEVRPPSGYGVFACMLGGPDGTTLLLCTAPDFLEHNRAPTREAVLVTTTVDVPHAGRP